MRLRVTLAGSLIGGLMIWACGGEETTIGPGGQQPPAPTVASVAVTPSTATLTAVGATVQLSASAQDASGNTISGKTFTWSSSDEAIASVSSSGVVTAVADGSATITATTDGINGTATIDVQQAVASVTVAPPQGTVPAFETLQLTATATDAEGSPVAEVTFTWESSDDAVATVDATGLVTGVAPGTAVVTATAGGQSGTADMVVTPGAFTPAEDTELEGTVEFASVLIADGVTVTATGDLVMNVSGGVEVAGGLVGDCVAITVNGGSDLTITGEVRNDCTIVPAGDLPDLVLIGNGDLTLDGSVIASFGDVEIKNDPTLTETDFDFLVGDILSATALASEEAEASVQQPFDCNIKNFERAFRGRPPPGDPGRFGRPGFTHGNFKVFCRGSMIFESNTLARLFTASDGGPGEHSDAVAASASGGNGGGGSQQQFSATGDIIFRNTFRGRTIFGLTDGGYGGHAVATGLENASLSKGASATAVAGNGGDAEGLVVVARGELSIDPGALEIRLGKPGVGGEATATGAKGRDGDGEPAGDGGDASAFGGTGGSSPDVIIGALGGVVGNSLDNVLITGGGGNIGGSALATGGVGGAGTRNQPNGGAGGSMTAIGGSGGASNTRNPAGELIGAGGDGGLATFLGGNGGNGFIDCEPGQILPGGHGGAGGSATGEDGPGGTGRTSGQPGGVVVGRAGGAGVGGNGGDGEPPGNGGEPGTDLITARGGRFDAGANFQRGQDGNPCPVAAKPIGFTQLAFTATESIRRMLELDRDSRQTRPRIETTEADLDNGVFIGSTPDPFAFVRTSFDPATGLSRDIFTAADDGTNQQNITNHSAFYRRGSANAAGTQLVYESDRDDPQQFPFTVLNDVFVMNIDGTGLQNIITDAGFPSFTPDGRVVYSADGDADGLNEIRIANGDGTGSSLLIDDDNANNFSWFEAVVSPDGTKIAVTRSSSTGFEIVVGDFAGTSVTNLQVVASEGNNFNPTWSPGSDEIAFTSTRTGDQEIWVTKVDGTGQANLTQSPSTEDFHPFWRVP